MTDGCHWSRCAVLPLDSFSSLNICPYEEVLLMSTGHGNQSVSIIVQAVPAPSGSYVGIKKMIMQLHPFVQEFLTIATSKSSDNELIGGTNRGRGGENAAIACESRYNLIAQHASYRGNDCNPKLNTVDVETISFQIENIISSCDIVKIAVDEICRFDISLRFICSTSAEYDNIFRRCFNDDDYDQTFILNQMKQDLRCRTIRKDVFLPICMPPIPGVSTSEVIAIFHIEDVMSCTKSCQATQNEKLYYTIGDPYDSISIDIIAEAHNNRAHGKKTTRKRIITNCPGYTRLMDDMIDLANISTLGGSPTGILLNGCRGVGKTRLATAILDRLMSSEQMEPPAKVLSAKEIILQASSSMDLLFVKNYIKKQICRSDMNRRAILIIDDLDVIIENDDEESSMDNEKRMCLHAVAGVVDDLNNRADEYGSNNDLPPFILGVCCDNTSMAQSPLTRIGRFEKAFFMLPPSEIQRREITEEMLNYLPITTIGSKNKGELRNTWSSALAKQTAGCVAADLKRICTDALTRFNARVDATNNDQTEAGVKWSELRESARMCVPSQLKQLDVTLAIQPDNNAKSQSQSLSPRESFFQFWDRKFVGYHETKKRIFRTIYWPWKRHTLKSSKQVKMSSLEKEVSPPSGVLFYGESGTGKTYGAECLAASLGLHIIRIRASDILDQWLGGSEAAIRAIFARARSAAPCILFFDELDAIATNRDDNEGGSSDVHSRLLSTLLNEMDGVNSDNSNSNILIVGTTNRINAIDAALKRPGRFEQHILLELPTLPDIELIMNKCLEQVPKSTDIDFHDIAELLEELGASAADVKGVCSDACLKAVDQAITSDDIDDLVLRECDLDSAIRLWKR